MKGIVLSVNRLRSRQKHTHNFSRRHHSFSFSKLLSKYKYQMVFFVVFMAGQIFSIVYSAVCDDDFVKQLDFLFVTNLDFRLKATAFEVFCSSFSADFIFILITFLLGFSSWGMAVLPFVCAFKGFGVGLSAACMFINHSISGVGFYILVVLPGTVLFLFALLSGVKESFLLSIKFFKYIIPTTDKCSVSGYIKYYLYRYFIVTVLTLLCAVVDMTLWVLFAHMFKF